ncbi:MAG: nitroreductase family protein [Candidatus Gastranaerophilales bacterium]|nr:nitroreductase family protein [Candidatus Gastranaerophilales bacterium]
MVLEIIANRHSVRCFSDKSPNDNQLDEILEAAYLAPSWLNVQPWHFVIVKNQTNKDLLAKLAHGQPHVSQAPVVIVCCGDLGAWEYKNYKKTLKQQPDITDEKINQILSNSLLNPTMMNEQTVFIRTLEQVPYAIAYMTLEAHNQGLASCIIGNIANEITKSTPEVYQDVKKALGLPQNMFILSLLLLGYPATKTSTRKIRKQRTDIISKETYSEK